MQVGDRDVDLDQAFELLQAYAVEYANTVRFMIWQVILTGSRVLAVQQTQSMQLPLAISAALSS